MSGLTIDYEYEEFDEGVGNFWEFTQFMDRNRKKKKFDLIVNLIYYVWSHEFHFCYLMFIMKEFNKYDYRIFS